MVMSERKFTLKITEGELLALIYHHSIIIARDIETEVNPAIDNSERLHDLVKRLNKTTPEIEEIKEPAQATAAKEEQQQSW